MAKVALGMTMSLDGFINDRNGSVERLYPDLADLRHMDPLQESINNTGAVVMGWNSFAMAEDPDWFAGNYEYQAPIFVLTHFCKRSLNSKNVCWNSKITASTPCWWAARISASSGIGFVCIVVLNTNFHFSYHFALSSHKVNMKRLRYRIIA